MKTTPKISTINAKAATPALIKEACIVLGAAFQDDPSMVYAIGSKTPADKRAKIVRAICTDMVRYAAHFAQLDISFTSDDRVAGVAIWLAPGQHISTLQMIQTGCWKWPFVMSLGVIMRSIKYSDVLEEYHTKNMPDDHYYLYMLGVCPDQQNQGIGGELLEYKLRQASEASASCYLESFNERNLSFYARYGFEQVGTAHTPDEVGPQFWMLKRSF